MPVTYKKIASVTVTGATQAEIDFTSIPSTYTDLVIKLSYRSDQNIGTAALFLRYNGSTTNFSYRRLVGDGSATSSANASTSFISIAQGGNTTASTFANTEIYIPNYAGSTNKSASADNVNETNGTTEYATLTAHLWSSTSAITSIKLLLSAGNFVQYSTATLYGISKS